MVITHKIRWTITVINLRPDYNVSQKNVPPLACYSFDAHECILIFFGRNVTDKVGNQKTLYYATSNNSCSCTTWQNGETWRSHFSLNWIVLHTCSWKKKLSSVMCLIASDICWDSKISHSYCPLTLLQTWRRTTPTFYTATDTMTDLASTEHVGNRQHDAMLPS